MESHNCEYFPQKNCLQKSYYGIFASSAHLIITFQISFQQIVHIEQHQLI